MGEYTPGFDMKEDLKRLKDVCQKTVALVDAEEYGLSSWLEAVARKVTELNELTSSIINPDRR